MDYLTFTVIHTMIIISLCGIVYLCRQCASFLKWFVKNIWNDLEEKEEESS